MRTLFERDHPLPGLRGVKRRPVRSSSSGLFTLSIQPKLRASGMDSSYVIRALPVAALYATSHTPSALSWLSCSHRRHSAAVVT